MKFSIRKKLIVSGLVVLMFFFMMVVASQVVVRIFSNTSNNLVVEYVELDALLEFKISLNNLLMPPANYAINGHIDSISGFDHNIHEAKKMLAGCRKIVTDFHNHQLFDHIENQIDTIESIGLMIYRLHPDTKRDQIIGLLENCRRRVYESIAGLDVLLDETKIEIDEYTRVNSVIITHSRATIFSIGLLLIILIIVGGTIFIRHLTRPIKELVETTQKISKGDHTAKVSIKSSDELGLLAESFNSMIDNLEKTTVSRNYLDDILKSMFDPLFVVNIEGKIESTNNAAQALLSYSETELQGMEVNNLFDNHETDNTHMSVNIPGIIASGTVIDSEKYLVAKDNRKIPVLFSASVMKTKDGNIRGIIIIAHNLTEKITIEKKLEHTRKERSIAINEAQEVERMRVATDLHDGLGQILTAISYSVQEICNSDDAETDIMKVQFQAVQEQLEMAISETKSLAHNLIPIVLKDFGLIVAIKNLIEQVKKTHDIIIRFDSFNFDLRIDPKLEKALYRICQESLNNIVKHAEASNAVIQIYRYVGSVVLVIEDDGKGFDVDAVSKDDNRMGIGLMSIRERVQSFNGIISFESEPGKGTEIMIEIPCRSKSTLT